VHSQIESLDFGLSASLRIAGIGSSFKFILFIAVTSVPLGAVWLSIRTMIRRTASCRRTLTLQMRNGLTSLMWESFSESMERLVDRPGTFQQRIWTRTACSALWMPQYWRGPTAALSSNRTGFRLSPKSLTSSAQLTDIQRWELVQ